MGKECYNILLLLCLFTAKRELKGNVRRVILATTKSRALEKIAPFLRILTVKINNN